MGRMIALVSVLLAGCATAPVQTPVRTVDWVSEPPPKTLMDAIEVPHSARPRGEKQLVPSTLLEAVGDNPISTQVVLTNVPWLNLRTISWSEAWKASQQGHLVGDVRGPGSRFRDSLPCATSVWAPYPKSILHSLHPRNGRVILYGGRGEFDLVIQAAELLTRQGYTRLELVEGDYEAWQTSIGTSFKDTVFCFNSLG